MVFVLEYDLVYSEDEICILMKESNKSGLIDNIELVFVDNIFDFMVIIVCEIMILWMEMICLNVNQFMLENLEIVSESM